jgi:hypothetical protein
LSAEAGIDKNRLTSNVAGLVAAKTRTTTMNTTTIRAMVSMVNLRMKLPRDVCSCLSVWVGRSMFEAETLSRCAKTLVTRPQLHAMSQRSTRQQVHVYEADAVAMQGTTFNELQYFLIVGDGSTRQFQQQLYH